MGVELGGDLRPVEGVDVGAKVGCLIQPGGSTFCGCHNDILSTSVIPGRDEVASYDAQLRI
jgi:hypothetical protein